MSRSIVFVYGTLKRGFFNEKIINTSGASFLRTARTVKAFPLVVGEYGVPYLLPPRQDEGCRIMGELWEVGPLYTRRTRH